jgi:hypothetical protein
MKQRAQPDKQAENMPNPVHMAVLAIVCAVITTVAGTSLLSITRDTGARSQMSGQPPAAATAEEPAPVATLTNVEVATPEPAVDPTAFGKLPVAIAAPAPPPRPSLLDKPAMLALAVNPLQNLAESFAQSPVEAALPGMGGRPSPLDGPADAGMEIPVIAADVAPQAPLTGKVIALDASEGTKLDPLRQRAWDLNATQVVPPLTTR